MELITGTLSVWGIWPTAALHSPSQHIPLYLICWVSISRKFNTKCQSLHLKFPKQFFFFPQRKHLISVEEKGLSGAVYHDVGRPLKEKLKWSCKAELDRRLNLGISLFFMSYRMFNIHRRHLLLHEAIEEKKKHNYKKKLCSHEAERKMKIWHWREHELLKEKKGQRTSFPE